MNLLTIMLLISSVVVPGIMCVVLLSFSALTTRGSRVNINAYNALIIHFLFLAAAGAANTYL